MVGRSHNVTPDPVRLVCRRPACRMPSRTAGTATVRRTPRPADDGRGVSTKGSTLEANHRPRGRTRPRHHHRAPGHPGTGRRHGRHPRPERLRPARSATPAPPGTTRCRAPACTSGRRARRAPTRWPSTSTPTRRWPTSASRRSTTRRRAGRSRRASSWSSTSTTTARTDGILVGEPTFYGDNWWLNNAADAFVKAGAPHTRRRLRQRLTTARWTEWRTAFPDAAGQGLRVLAGLRREGRRRHQRDQLQQHAVHVRRRRRPDLQGPVQERRLGDQPSRRPTRTRVSA